MKNWCVYMHENAITGKRYIGITGQKPERRWQNGNGYRSSSRFFSALKRYGWDNFRHYILYVGLTQAEAEQLEVELIAKYQTQDPAHGYNMAEGGSAPQVTEATRVKQSLAKRGEKHPGYGKPAWNRGLRMSDATRAKLSAMRTGEKHPRYGQHLSAETKAKIRTALAGKPRGPASAETKHRQSIALRGHAPTNSIPIVCVETGDIYASARAAGLAATVDGSGVLKACRGKQKTAGGYHWAFVPVTNETQP